MGDLAVGFRFAAGLALPEVFGGEDGLEAANEILDGEKACAGRFSGSGDYGDDARVGQEERAEAVPIAGLAGGSGEDVVESVEDGVDGGCVGGVGSGWHGCPS